MRASTVEYCPASLNESGVALMTAMMSGLSTSIMRPRACSCDILSGYLCLEVGSHLACDGEVICGL